MIYSFTGFYFACACFIYGNETVNNVNLYNSEGFGLPSGRSTTTTLLSNNSILIYGGSGYNTTANDLILNDLWSLSLCNCTSGLCLLNESASCALCNNNYFGPNCICNASYWGPTCNFSCLCVNGECDPLNGNCTCLGNYFGEYCDKRCLTSDCSTNCICNNSNTCSNNETLCTDDVVNFTDYNITIVSTNTTNLNILNINNSSIFFIGTFLILGNTSIDNSTISFTISDSLIEGDLSFSNTSFTFSNSSIIVDGCINLKNNTHITIDLSKYSIGDKDTKITLIKSLKSCINKEGNIFYEYINQPLSKCISISNTIDSDSLSVFIKFNPCTSFSHKMIQLWIITFIIMMF